jgi:hypothetical protein
MEFKKWLYLERQSDSLSKLLNASYKMLKFLYVHNNYKNETLSRNNLPKELFNSSSCGKWCMWIKRFNQQFESNPNVQTECGSEGCALFAGNKIVIKFTYGRQEATIATLIKGNPNFPVIDTTYYDGIYAIAMKELTIVSGEIENQLSRAHTIVSSFFRSIDWTFDSKNILEKFKSWHLKIASELEHMKISQQEIQFSYKLLELIIIIKDKTGYVLGNDWYTHNIGINDKNEIQPFDFGYPEIKSNLSPKTAEIPSLEQ